MDCKHKGKKIYVEREDGIWMVCKLCGKFLAIATGFQQRDVPDNLFEQIDKPEVMGK